MKRAHGHDRSAGSLHLGDFGGKFGQIRSFTDAFDVFAGVRHEASVTGHSTQLLAVPEREKEGKPGGRGGSWASLLFSLGDLAPSLKERPLDLATFSDRGGDRRTLRDD